MATIEEEYALVKTFDDFIKTNIKFLNGIYNHTAYHVAPVNEETIPMLDDLKIVNKLGYFTIDSQPSSSEERFREFNGYGFYNLFQERGYLQGFIHNHKNLKEYLESKNEIYYLISYPDLSYISNIPFEDSKCFRTNREIYYYKNNSEKIYLSEWEEGYSGIQNFNYFYDDYNLFNDSIKKVLDDCVHLCIITKDFNSKVNLQKLMIDYFLEN